MRKVSHDRGAISKETTSLRWPIAGVVVLAVGLIILIWRLSGSEDPIQTEVETGKTVVRVHQPIPVSANRNADVRDGFRGDIHPMLHGRTQLKVTANWTAPEKSQLKMEAPETVQSWYSGLSPVAPQIAYSARDFSGFLPESVTDVGQVWALDSDKMETFLRQFHPRPSMHLSATGRRAGPDGAFAVLRAVSPSHLDIAFRIHAEFFITPRDAGDLQSVHSWYTPAYFHGRVLVDKITGTVELFRLALPTEKALNVFLTVNPSLLGIPKLAHDIVRVERMELSGGDEKRADRIGWAKSITSAEADRRLARVFYKFEEIDWVPIDQVANQARSKNRPIFAIVSWGATDDQSC